jgi:hypothetical protein
LSPRHAHDEAVIVAGHDEAHAARLGDSDFKAASERGAAMALRAAANYALDQIQRNLNDLDR